MGIQITRTGDILGMSEQIFFPELIIFLNFSFEILWIMEKKNEAANVLAISDLIVCHLVRDVTFYYDAI